MPNIGVKICIWLKLFYLPQVRHPSFLCLMVRTRPITLTQTVLASTDLQLCGDPAKFFSVPVPRTWPFRAFSYGHCDSLSSQQWKTAGISAPICRGFQLSSLASLPTQHHNLTILLRRRTAVFKVLQVSNFITPIPSEWQKLCWVPRLHQWSSLGGQAWILQLQLYPDLPMPPGKKLELSIHVSSLLLKEFSGLIAFRFPIPSICFLSSRRLQKIPAVPF